MYEFPFGAGQQLNLNWIINEIITLHKQLDPDYELPNFDTAFPYMNLNTLNLDWILRELKAIKDLAPTEDAQLLKMVANALIANTYDAETQYNVDDIVYRDSDSRLYKCITATPAGGEAWDSSKWVEIDVGEVLTYLLVNGGGNTPTSDNVSNESDVTGATVTDALNNLDSEIDLALRTITETPLTNADDLNDYRTTGMYRIGGTVPANCPAGTWSQLLVTNVGTTRIQTIYNTNNNEVIIWQRSGGASTWNAWNKISAGNPVENRKDNKITSISVRGGNLLAFGDSWVEGYRASDAQHALPARLAARLGMTPINKGVGSSGFMMENNLITTQITNAAASMTNTEKAQTSLIFIFGGINDYRQYHATNSADDFATAVFNTLSQAVTSFPDIPIIIALGNGYNSPPPIYYYNWIDAAKEKIEAAVLNAQITIISTIPEFLCGQTDLYYTGDNLHLNDNGYNALAGYIANIASGGTPNIVRNLGAIICDSGITPTMPQCLLQYNRQCILTGGRYTFSGTNYGSKWLGTLPKIVPAGSSIIVPAWYNRQIVGVFEILTTNGRCAFYTEKVYNVMSGGNPTPVTSAGIPLIDVNELSWYIVGSWAL